MSLLRLHLPPDWPDLEPAAPLPWCTLGARGESLASGRALAAELPQADACELVIPAELVLLTHAALPRGSRQKQRQMLPYAIEDRLVAEPDAVHVAAGHADGDGQTALAAIDKAWLARVLARLAEAGLHPRSAWPEALLPELPAEAWVMVWNGRSGFLRSGAQAGMSLDGGSVEQPPAALTLSVAQARANDTAPRHLLLRLDAGAPTPDVDAWSRALGITVELGVEWAPLQRPDIPSGGIDLLQGAFAPSSKARDLWPSLRLPLILGGLIVLLQVGATTAEWWLLSREKQQLQAAMESSFRQAFPEARVVVDAPLQMQRNLADLRRAAGQQSALDFVPMLGRTATLLDTDSRDNLQAVTYENSQLSLDLMLPDPATAEALAGRLTDAGLASRVESISGEAPKSLARIVITGNTP